MGERDFDGYRPLVRFGPGELVAWVDKRDRLRGVVPREEVRRQNLRHRSVYVFVWNVKDELLVHQRAWTKDLYPGYWDLCVSGVPRWHESNDEAARRELAEEIGVSDAALLPLFSFSYEDTKNKVVGYVYWCEIEQPVRIQGEEILVIEFLRRDQVEQWIGTRQVCPDSLTAWRILTGQVK